MQVVCPSCPPSHMRVMLFSTVCGILPTLSRLFLIWDIYHRLPACHLRWLSGGGGSGIGVHSKPPAPLLSTGRFFWNLLVGRHQGGPSSGPLRAQDCSVSPEGLP